MALHEFVASNGGQVAGEAEPAVGVNNLHQALHAARRVVGPGNLVLRDQIVVLGGDGELSVDVDDVDVAAARAAAIGGTVFAG